MLPLPSLSPIRRSLASALPVTLFVVLAALLYGCAPNAVPPTASTSLPTDAPSPQLSPPAPVGTYGLPTADPNATLFVPDALATAEYKRVGPVPPTPTSSPTRDPRLPTYTPSSTPTPSPTPTTIPPPILLTDPVPDPQMADVRYFPSTGHTLRGVFLDYWQAHGGLAELGNPITEEFVGSKQSGGYIPPRVGITEDPNYPGDKSNLSGKELPVVQYFEKALIERYEGGTSTAEEFRVTSGGAQLARQKGYYSGLYPSYGHAVDFSWVAGEDRQTDGRACLGCGCLSIMYMLNKSALDASLVLSNITAAEFKRSGPEPYTSFYVLFGSISGDPGISISCGQPVYSVARAQQNPAP